MWDHDPRRCYGETYHILPSVHVSRAISSLSLKQVNQIDVTSERVNTPGANEGRDVDCGLHRNDFQKRPFTKVEGGKKEWRSLTCFSAASGFVMLELKMHGERARGFGLGRGL